MTLIGLMKYFDPEISDQNADYLIWNETAFPFCSMRMFVYQTRRAIRAHRNGIRRCELCGMKYPYHSRGCLEIPIIEMHNELTKGINNLEAKND